MSQLPYSPLTSMLPLSEMIPDPRPLHYRICLWGHMDFTSEFLCSHTLNFVYLEWEWLFPGNLEWESCCLETFSQILWCLNMLVTNCLASDSCSVIQAKSDWTAFSVSPLCRHACHDTCRDSLRAPLSQTWFGPQGYLIVQND